MNKDIRVYLHKMLLFYIKLLGYIGLCVKDAMSHSQCEDKFSNLPRLADQQIGLIHVSFQPPQPCVCASQSMSMCGTVLVIYMPNSHTFNVGRINRLKTESMHNLYNND